MAKIKVIIAGSGSFNDYNKLECECNRIFKELHDQGYDMVQENIEIISGNCNGADKLGEKFAVDYGLKLSKMPADWKQYPTMGGYIRNEEMALYAKKNAEHSVLIAFWDGLSKGTLNMLNTAFRHKIKIYQIKF